MKFTNLPKNAIAKNTTMAMMINVAKNALIFKTKIRSGMMIKINIAKKNNDPHPVKKSFP